MERKFKFEKLIIWQKGMELGEELNNLTQEYPDKEKFNLVSQTNRAVDSIALNISEGSICQSKPEIRKFMGCSIRSLAEVVTCLHKARNRSYIKEEQFDNYYLESYNLMNMMIAFRNKI